MYHLQTLSGQPQRTAGKFTVIETRSAVHQCQPLRQIDPKSPFILATARRLPVLSPLVPPGCNAPCDRLNDQDRSSTSRCSDEVSMKPVAQLSIKLIDREGRKN